MPNAIDDQPQTAENPSDEAQMSKYGITSKTVDIFYLGQYRYTNLRDAIAQAKRVAGET